MIETSGERYVEARCEQVWMVIDDANCLARWFDFADLIVEVRASEPSRRVEWGTQDHPAVASAEPCDCSTVMTVELFPEGAGTRVRIQATRESSGRINRFVTKITTQRTIDRHIDRSLDQLVQMLHGRTAA